MHRNSYLYLNISVENGSKTAEVNRENVISNALKITAKDNRKKETIKLNIMSKIKFKNCKVITEKKEENYAAFNVELESIKSLNLNGDNRQCEIIMKDGNVIKVHYYDDSVVL